MARTRVCTLLVSLLFLAAGLSPLAAQVNRSRYMPLDEVRPGMKGICRTVLSGATVEDIPAEVLGILPGFRPAQALILVRFSGEHIEKTGLVEGMSGSPVYIGGRLVGAMAYGWSFTTQPIAGLTPIENMLNLGPGPAKPAAPQPPVTLAAQTIDLTPDLERWCPKADPAALEPPGFVRRLTMPLCVGGFTPTGLDFLKRWTAGMPVSLVSASAAGPPLPGGRPVRLVPGATVCFEVVRGDISAVGVGTVTDISGDRVLAMGHPVLSGGGVGGIDLPMSTGYVQAVLPRQEISFKIASPVNMVGTFSQDQGAGMVGRIGPVPRLVPVEVIVHREDGRAPSDFRFEMTDDPQLMLSLSAAIISTCLTVRGDPAPEATLDLSTRIELDGLQPLVVSDSFAGPKALADGVGDVVNPLGYIIHNPFQKPSFKSIRIEATVSQGPGRAAVAEVSIPRSACRAGQTLEVRVTLQPVRAERLHQTLKVPLPADLEPGSYELTVCDSDTDLRLDAKDRPHLYQARDLPRVIAILNQPRPRNEIICRLTTRKAGVAVGPRAFGSLPGSALAILGGQTRSDVVSYTDPLRITLRTPYVIVGSYSTRLEVLPREEASTGVSREED